MHKEYLFQGWKNIIEETILLGNGQGLTLRATGGLTITSV